ncbi:MAG: 30S ribosomal protein S5 [Nitrospiraceae bacterium]|nr:30S ribosomal protein S5 [Nitrospiraceae bacterium]
MAERVSPEGLELKERVIHINRNAKVVAGGRKFSFTAFVVVGNGNGVIGFGRGKASEVPSAIKKAVEDAKKVLLKIPVVDGTIPYEVRAKFGGAHIIMKPASPGTGVIASATVRAIAESIGITDILTKVTGSTNPHAVVRAVLEAFSQLKLPEEFSKLRGVSVEELRKRWRLPGRKVTEDGKVVAR